LPQHKSIQYFFLVKYIDSWENIINIKQVISIYSLWVVKETKYGILGLADLNILAQIAHLEVTPKFHAFNIYNAITNPQIHQNCNITINISLL